MESNCLHTKLIFLSFLCPLFHSLGFFLLHPKTLGSSIFFSFSRNCLRSILLRKKFSFSPILPQLAASPSLQWSHSPAKSRRLHGLQRQIIIESAWLHESSRRHYKFIHKSAGLYPIQHPRNER